MISTASFFYLVFTSHGARLRKYEPGQRESRGGTEPDHFTRAAASARLSNPDRRRCIKVALYVGYR